MKFYLEEDGAIPFTGTPQIFTEHLDGTLTPPEIIRIQEESAAVLSEVSTHPNIVFMKPGATVTKDFFGDNAFNTIRFFLADDLPQIANSMIGTTRYLVVVSHMFYTKDTYYNCFLVNTGNIERKIRLHFIDDILDSL